MSANLGGLEPRYVRFGYTDPWGNPTKNEDNSSGGPQEEMNPKREYGSSTIIGRESWYKSKGYAPYLTGNFVPQEG